jgi:hypothetical protein
MTKVLVVLAVLAIIVFGILHFHGFFIEPQITEKEIGPYTVASTRFVGSYSKVGPVMEKVDAWLRSININSTKGIGLYYDDPSKVEASKLRSDVGDILEDIDNNDLNKISEKYDIKNIQKTKAVVTEFPIRSMLSYMIAPTKVYPVLNKYWQEKGYEKTENGYIIEIYDVQNKTIQFIMPIIEKQ